MNSESDLCARWALGINLTFNSQSASLSLAIHVKLDAKIIEAQFPHLKNRQNR